MHKSTSTKKYNCPFIGFLDFWHNFFYHHSHNHHIAVKPSSHLPSILERNETIVVIGLNSEENR